MSYFDLSDILFSGISLSCVLSYEVTFSRCVRVCVCVSVCVHMALCLPTKIYVPEANVGCFRL